MALSIREADAKRLLWGTTVFQHLDFGDESSISVGRESFNSIGGDGLQNGKANNAVAELEQCMRPLQHRHLKGFCVSIDASTCVEDLPRAHPWLLTSRLVLKPDVLLKRRGKSNLVKLNLNWREVQEALQQMMGLEVECQSLTGVLDHFIVEPFFPHDEKANEFYVTIRTLRTGDEILFSPHGGVNVGDVENHARKVLIPVRYSDSGAVAFAKENKDDCLNNNVSVSDTYAFPGKNVAKLAAVGETRAAAFVKKAGACPTMAASCENASSAHSLWSDQELIDLFASACLFEEVADTKAKCCLPSFLIELYRRFCVMHFAFLEINPFSYDSVKQTFVVLDCAAKLDHTADFLCEKLWGPISFPNPFGRRFTAAEQYIRDLDSKTGASLKLTVLNPEGRIWTLIAGGGASVVYTDTVCDLGMGHELANYGEYSGAPSEVTTYEYTKTILGLMTAPGTFREEGKLLLIGGGIANFTNVADTFQGIIRALRDFREQLREYRVRIYVRRGGPNYQEGLKRMREVGEELNIKMKVFGPETYMTSIIPVALNDDLLKEELPQQQVQPVEHRQQHFSAAASLPNGDAVVSQTVDDFARVHGWDIGTAAASADTSSRSSSKNLPTAPATECTKEHSPASAALRGLGYYGRLDTWQEMTMEQIDKNPIFEKYINNFLANRKNSSSPAGSTDCADTTHRENVSLNVPRINLLTKQTRCFVWGLQTRAVQEMLDFDHACGRKEPSVAAIIYEFSVSHCRPFYFGTEEVYMPVYETLEEAVKQHGEVEVLINFASMRSAAAVSRLALEQAPNLHTVVVIAEGVPEREARELAAEMRDKGVCLIGPATVGGIRSGAFRIGNTGGTLENVMNARLYRPGSVGCVTKSGGLLNEMNNILSIVSDGTYEAIAIGGDRFPGTTMLDHLLRFEKNPDIKLLVLLGEVGGDLEYEVIDAIRDGRITKPVVAWCVGVCASLFSTEVSFGHAGAWAGTGAEHAAAKNNALKAAGAFVPRSFQELGKTIRQVYGQLVKQGVMVPPKEDQVPRIPMDYAWAKKLGLVRKPKGFISTISDDRGEELVYAGWPISKVLGDEMGVGGVISLLWFKRPLPRYCYRYLERVLMLTADHGPAVCGAHNVIVTARAGKDLISSLISGLCTIGDRFGGACDQAAQQFLGAFSSGVSPRDFVAEMKCKNKLIMGIGHRFKSVHNPDMRVHLLKTFCKEHFPQTPLINFAEEVEMVTTKKKDTLILNVDGLIGVSMCDMLFHCGNFTENEAKDYIQNGCINGLFVLGRSIGFIGHFLDQKRLKQGLYRHDVDDIAYVIPDWSSNRPNQ